MRCAHPLDQRGGVHHGRGAQVAPRDQVGRAAAEVAEDEHGQPAQDEVPLGDPQLGRKNLLLSPQQAVGPHSRLGLPGAAARKRDQGRGVRRAGLLRLPGRVRSPPIAPAAASGQAQWAGRKREPYAPQGTHRAAQQVGLGAGDQRADRQLPAAALDVRAPHRRVDEDGDQAETENREQGDIEVDRHGHEHQDRGAGAQARRSEHPGCTCGCGIELTEARRPEPAAVPFEERVGLGAHAGLLGQKRVDIHACPSSLR